MSRSDLIFLVPAGRDRFELYSETPEEPGPAPAHHDGQLRRLIHAGVEQWHQLVDAARRGSSSGRFRRWRDRVVCRLAESIAEQRTLWSLRDRTTATIHYPATLDRERARTTLRQIVADARRHHLRWLIVDLVLFVASGILFFVPGPNLIAYYIAFRLFGHLQSWRGARQSMEVIQWAFEPDEGLAELASLVDVPREARAPKVAAIAARLNLPRLSAFFDRVAMPVS
jgi:hypothetical protein